MKRDVGIAFIAMRKIHYNVMRFRDTLNVDEAEVLAGRRFNSVSGRHYVLHDPEKLVAENIQMLRIILELISVYFKKI